MYCISSVASLICLSVGVTLTGLKLAPVISLNKATPRRSAILLAIGVASAEIVASVPGIFLLGDRPVPPVLDVIDVPKSLFLIFLGVLELEGPSAGSSNISTLLDIGAGGIGSALLVGGGGGGEGMGKVGGLLIGRGKGD